MVEDCSCESVSMEMYREQLANCVYCSLTIYARGFAQRKNLDLQRAFELAKQLDAAQKQALTYQSSVVPTPCSVSHGPERMVGSSNTEGVEDPALSISNAVCYFCGSDSRRR